MSVYFQLFLIVLFYTPLADYVRDHYTATFLIRFPMLYFASFGACTIMMSQRQELFNKVHKQAFYDGLTDMYNRAYYKEYCCKAEEFPNLTIIAMDLNGLKYVNDTLGHEAGDKMICEAASFIRSAFPDDACFRIGGDEFIVISNSEDTLNRIDALRVGMPNMSLGYASRMQDPDLSLFDLSKKADGDMYIDKAKYYQQRGTNRETHS